MTEPYAPPDLAGTALRYDENYIPEFHGPNQDYIYPGRRVVIIPGRLWPDVPEECEVADDPGEVEWLAGGRLLVCLGCGLDCT